MPSLLGIHLRWMGPCPRPCPPGSSPSEWLSFILNENGVIFSPHPHRSLPPTIVPRGYSPFRMQVRLSQKPCIARTGAQVHPQPVVFLRLWRVKASTGPQSSRDCDSCFSVFPSSSPSCQPGRLSLPGSLAIGRASLTLAIQFASVFSLWLFSFYF